VLTINKGYAYKQTVDQLEDNPYLNEVNEKNEKNEHQKEKE
jgi:hypothetical protein